MLFIYSQGQKFSHYIWSPDCFEFWFSFSSAILLSEMESFFSAWEQKFANFFMCFWKHKSVFFQILHQCSVPSDITPMCYFRSKIIYFKQKKALKCNFFRISSARVKIREISQANFGTTNQFLFQFRIILNFYGN